MRTVILPSPLLGPSTYVPLAQALRAAGHPTVVAGVRPDTVDSVLAGFVADADGAEVVVPHSNAGRFAPTVAAVAGAATVHLDSALPGEDNPGHAAFVDTLVEEDGLLPPWTSWWPADEIDALLPGGWRATAEAEGGRWPLDFLLQDPPVPADWHRLPAAYVAFGATYETEARRAASYGWPVHRLRDADHLHHLRDPAGVAAAVLDLARALG